jgi:hypothetical protein
MFACSCAESKKHGGASPTATSPEVRRKQDRHAWTPAHSPARLHNANDSHPSALRQRCMGNQAMLRMLARSSRTASQAGQTMEESPHPKKRSSCPACAKDEENSGQRTLTLVGERSIASRDIGPADAGKTADAGQAADAGKAADAGQAVKADGGTDKPAPPDVITGASPICPNEIITIGNPVCGHKYGAVASYCLGNIAKGWWFKESVENGPGPLCQPGDIKQTSNPFQSPDGCVGDSIADNNGPPSAVAPCNDLTLQTVFAGPTKEKVEQCAYHHDQVINVAKTATGGTVTTSAGPGASTHCDWI